MSTGMGDEPQHPSDAFHDEERVAMGFLTSLMILFGAEWWQMFCGSIP